MVRRYTVRETSPGINHLEPGEPIYWHWSVEATSEQEAVGTVSKARTGEYDARVVPPLG
jgi:hypothetical protein